MSEKFLWRALLLSGLAVATACGSPEAFKSLAITTGAGGSGPGAAGVSGSAGIGGATGTAGISGDAGNSGATGLAGASGLAGSTGAAGNTGNAGASGAAGTAAGGVGGGKAGAGGAAGSKADAGADASAGSGGAAGGGADGAAGAPQDAAPPVNYCDRSHWKATASASYAMAPAGPAIQGIDGNLTTRWTSGRSQDGTDFYQVDFGGTVKLTKITLDDTGDNSVNDFPLMYQVFGSTDGTTFGATAFATGSGAASSTTITFTERAVRAVKIKEVGAKAEWWSIGELVTACSL